MTDNKITSQDANRFNVFSYGIISIVNKDFLFNIFIELLTKILVKNKNEIGNMPLQKSLNSDIRMCYGQGTVSHFVNRRLQAS